MGGAGGPGFDGGNGGDAGEIPQAGIARLTDLHGALAQQSDRLTSRLSEELNLTRETLHKLQLSLAANLGETTDKLNAKIDQRLEPISGKVRNLDPLVKKPNYSA